MAKLCRHYGISCVSLRDAIYSEVMAAAPGYSMPEVAGDCVHPSKSTRGPAIMGDLVVHALQRLWDDARPLLRASAPPEAPSPIHRPLFLEESPGERTLALEAPARSPRGALAGGDASSDVYREQLAAYPLPNVELRDLASLRATGALDLRVVRFAMPAPRQRFASTRDPIVLAWELPKFDDTTLRYTVELRPPGHGDLVAEARRRSGAPSDGNTVQGAPAKLPPPTDLAAAALTARSNGASAATLRQLCETNVRPVSYTHLPLPTILLV